MFTSTVPLACECQDWLDAVDFLEQCKPRLMTLINVGTTGQLDEEVFMKCIELNEQMCVVLEGKPFEEVSCCTDCH